MLRARGINALSELVYDLTYDYVVARDVSWVYNSLVNCHVVRRRSLNDVLTSFVFCGIQVFGVIEQHRQPSGEALEFVMPLMGDLDVRAYDP